MFLPTQRANLAFPRLGYHFIGGVLAHAEALCALTNPTVNSLQAHQRAGDDLGRHVVAKYRHLRRQQPHPHDPHS